MKILCVLAALAVAVSALPTKEDPIIAKYSGDGERYQYVQDGNGELHLVDMWLKASDLEEAARYNPDVQNVFHLYTRENPSVSQPLLFGNEMLLSITNYNPRRRTIILLHGWRVDVNAALNRVAIPAFLAAEDVNVIVVDWSAGAGSINYLTAVANTKTSGESLARFIDWLSKATGASLSQFHLVGHSIGAHKAGIAGRNLNGGISYITGLDPALLGYVFNNDRLTASDSQYTEVIHTNAGLLGYAPPLGHVDFYPNGGVNMPGCSSQDCDHAMSYHYFAESLVSGGFTGRRCSTYLTAMTHNCILLGRLKMGGLKPKTGSKGIYYLLTNPSSPYSRG